MNHLPLEIQHTIFIILDLKDRLQCMLVCRSWYDILNQYSLLYSVDITCSQFPQFKDMLERLPFRATQVEKLTMIVDPKSTSDKRKLCNMLPNLRELALDTSFDVNTTIDYMAMQFQFVNSTSKLERISDIGDCHLTRQLAISNQLGLLKTLVLSFGDAPYSVCLQTILQLMNMPVLKELRLRNLKCKLMDLEVLHNNLPSVQYLKLKKPYLISGENPREVQPAPLITEIDLALEDVYEPDVHIQFYQYSIKKYPFINTVRYFDITLADYGAHDSRKIFVDGVLPFLQKFGSKLNTFISKTISVD